LKGFLEPPPLLISSSAESTVSGALVLRRLRNDLGLPIASGGGDFLPRSTLAGLIVEGVSGLAADLLDFGVAGSVGLAALDVSVVILEGFGVDSSDFVLGGENSIVVLRVAFGVVGSVGLAVLKVDVSVAILEGLGVDSSDFVPGGENSVVVLRVVFGVVITSGALATDFGVVITSGVWATDLGVVNSGALVTNLGVVTSGALVVGSATFDVDGTGGGGIWVADALRNEASDVVFS